MDTDRPDSRNARFVRFTVTAGPGPLGAAFRQEWRAIEAPAGIPRMERVTVLDANRADFRHGVLGPHVSHNALLSQSPAVLQVNEVPVVGVSLKRVAMTMASAPRPMTLLMQVGCPGQSSLSLDSRGGDAVEDVGDGKGLDRRVSSISRIFASASSSSSSCCSATSRGSVGVLGRFNGSVGVGLRRGGVCGIPTGVVAAVCGGIRGDAGV